MCGGGVKKSHLLNFRRAFVKDCEITLYFLLLSIVSYYQKVCAIIHWKAGNNKIIYCLSARNKVTYSRKNVIKRPATTGIFSAFPFWYRCFSKGWKCFLFFFLKILSSSYFPNLKSSNFSQLRWSHFLRNNIIWYAFYSKFATLSDFK